MKRDDLNLLTDPSVELIKPYIFTSRGIAHDHDEVSAEHWAEVCAAQGGYTPRTREVVPMKFVTAEMAMHEALDHITAAVEAGVVDKNRWASQLFADHNELAGFLDELQGYDECFRITDRWWTALAGLANRMDEEAFVSCAEIEHGLRESIDDGGRRCEVLRQEAEYFAQYPLKRVKATRAHADALDEHNHELRSMSYRTNGPLDISFEFGFTQPFLFMKGKALAARQATADDLAALVNGKKSPAATKAPEGKAAKRRTRAD